MARQFCALLLVFGLAATCVTFASPDARPLGIPTVRPAAERNAPPPGPAQPRASGCGKKAVLVPAQRADISARLAAAAMRVLTQVAELPALWLDQRGLDRAWHDDLKTAMEDLRRCVLEAYGQAYSRVVGIGGIGS
jgi:hypothetical protein